MVALGFGTDLASDRSRHVTPALAKTADLVVLFDAINESAVTIIP
jgi:hypothetical protein